MRLITEQLADINSGKMTIADVLAEGVSAYAIRYYSPSTAEQAQAYYPLLRAWKLEQDSATKRVPQALVMCSCGHQVFSSQVMNASLGTACPDCYDKMC